MTELQIQGWRSHGWRCGRGWINGRSEGSGEGCEVGKGKIVQEAAWEHPQSGRILSPQVMWILFQLTCWLRVSMNPRTVDQWKECWLARSWCMLYGKLEVHDGDCVVRSAIGASQMDTNYLLFPSDQSLTHEMHASVAPRRLKGAGNSRGLGCVDVKRVCKNSEVLKEPPTMAKKMHSLPPATGDLITQFEGTFNSTILQKIILHQCLKCTARVYVRRAVVCSPSSLAICTLTWWGWRGSDEHKRFRNESSVGCSYSLSFHLDGVAAVLEKSCHTCATWLLQRWMTQETGWELPLFSTSKMSGWVPAVWIEEFSLPSCLYILLFSIFFWCVCTCVRIRNVEVSIFLLLFPSAMATAHRPRPARRSSAKLKSDVPWTRWCL